MFNIRSTIDPDVCDDGYQCNQHDNSAVGMVYAKERLSILRKAEIRKFGDDDIQCTKYKKVGTSCQVICGDDHKNLENCVENDCIKTLEDFELGKVPYAKDDGEGNFKYSTAGWDCAQQMKPRPDHHSFRKVEFWIDYKAASASEAAMNILYMLFICLIFALSSLVFMMDLNVLVIEPVENMSAAMQLVSEKLLDLGGSGDGGEAAYIESSILKIVSLLKVSFGDAGTRIIANNMTADSDTIQPMVPGVKVFGCFGMIDIREFTATTEALREKVTIFVNEFGEINHSRCKETGGSPNKNVGDAFLCVWIDKDGMAPPADDVLACYRRCIQDVRQSEQLAELIELHQIKERFPPKQQEFGKYRARHGCGLHYGMAIEGAIGSARKIDASYLGPDVDLSDVLEASTKVYKVPILVSQAFYNELSENIQKGCRKVDRVKVDGIAEPFNIYAPNVANVDGNFFDPSIVEDVYEIELSDEQTVALTFGKDGAEDPRENDERWRLLVDGWNEDFEAAVESYLDRDWDAAKTQLLECLSSRPWDGPSLKLMAYMRQMGSPQGWQGFAELL